MLNFTLNHQQDPQIPKFLNLGKQLTPNPKGAIYCFLPQTASADFHPNCNIKFPHCMLDNFLKKPIHSPHHLQSADRWFWAPQPVHCPPPSCVFRSRPWKSQNRWEKQPYSLYWKITVLYWDTDTNLTDNLWFEVVKAAELIIFMA